MTLDAPLPDHNAASQAIALSVRRFAEAVVLEVSGDVDLVTAAQLAAAVREVVDEDPSVLVIDLLRVSLLTSAGIAVLAEARELCGDETRLQVVAAGGVAGRVLELTGLDQLLDVYASRDDALAQ